MDITGFTPFSSLLGGLLIGLAATALMVGIGRIMGISGITAGLLDTPLQPNWRHWFVAGLALSPLVSHLVTGPVSIQADASPLMLVVAGLVVGIGTRIGSGCTSGHGVCGLSRLSVRSGVAVPVFIGAATVTVYFTRHVIG